ncbi:MULTISPECIES: flagellar protein FlaG [unclassified Alteromonas]|jgi:flagellar protein FlaG|uniref:flagellar protein FlaG n=1 Tax=unclassified Alteromonas TaxID=2614992 RepID=UPI001EF1C3EE|nr:MULTISPECIES: flagellar protein FlaG [unclassified Alteromonas]MCG7643844.1 flagellar protein FlaG [Alteromonas sp. MmMcT2-2]|tara:strand:- start:6345 stop:6812 length:468 start_codon:yes stop_codon:yes gene_type:complete
MDIKNIQDGQAIAAALSTRVEASAQSPQVQQNETSDSNERSLQSVSESTDNQGNVIQNLSQVLQATSDIENRAGNEMQLDDAISRVESFLQGQNRNLTFSIDENTERSVVTVLDSDSGDVIRQIPSEELLVLAERIQELQQDVGSRVGVLINNQV